MAVHALQPCDPDWTAAPLFAPLRGPAFKGPSGDDLACRSCSETLIEGCVEGEIWGLAFRCPKCGAFSRAAERPPGRALGTLVQAWPRDRMILAAPIALGHGHAHVPDDVRTERQRELEERKEPSLATDRIRFDDPGALRELLARVRSLLRDTALDVEKRDMRARVARSGAASRHRLGASIADLENAVEALEKGAPFRFSWVRSIVELKMATSFFATWSKDPAWEQMRLALKEPTTYTHDVSLLAIATHFARNENDVWLRAAPGDGRTADLRIVATARHSMDVEIKAPKDLRDRTSPLSVADAERLVNRNLQRAQLAESAALLVIGGFHLTEGDMATLCAAASRRLAHVTNRTNVAGIVFLSIGIANDYRDDSRSISRFRAILSARHAPNPHYAGSIPFQVRDVGDRDLRFDE